MVDGELARTEPFSEAHQECPRRAHPAPTLDFDLFSGDGYSAGHRALPG
jgi:hypothetical protein